MKQTVFFLLAVLACCGSYAQTKPASNCPEILVEGPKDYTVTEGAAAIFKVKPFDKALATGTPTYNWMISAGTIVSGQGTSSIVADTKGLQGQSITATVEVGGLKAECSNVSSFTIDVLEKTITTPVKSNPPKTGVKKKPVAKGKRTK